MVLFYLRAMLKEVTEGVLLGNSNGIVNVPKRIIQIKCNGFNGHRLAGMSGYFSR